MTDAQLKAALSTRIRTVADGIDLEGTDEDKAARALVLIHGAAKFLKKRFGAHAAAEELYRVADRFAVQEDRHGRS